MKAKRPMKAKRRVKAPKGCLNKWDEPLLDAFLDLAERSYGREINRMCREFCRKADKLIDHCRKKGVIS